MSETDLTQRVEALEIILRSFLIQSASQWGEDAKANLDQWQAELTERHPGAANALNEMFEAAIRRFG